MQRNCAMYRTAGFIGKRWTLLVLLEIYRGRNQCKRYSQIKQGLPRITPKLLSLRLKELEKEGLIAKKIDAKTFPVKCEYYLTKSGKDFIRIIKSMKGWSLKWKLKNKQCENNDCGECEL